MLGPRYLAGGKKRSGEEYLLEDVLLTGTGLYIEKRMTPAPLAGDKAGIRGSLGEGAPGEFWPPFELPLPCLP